MVTKEDALTARAAELTTMFERGEEENCIAGIIEHSDNPVQAAILAICVSYTLDQKDAERLFQMMMARI